MGGCIGCPTATGKGLVAMHPKTRPRAIVLAILVEAQLLAPSLLSAFGLCHEVLVSESYLATGGCSGFPAWAWGQGVLSRFDDGLIDAIVACPRTMFCHNGSMGMAPTDAVVSLDEDWSSREASHLASLLARLSGPGVGMGSRLCKFIKIVCQDTCEEALLRPSNTARPDRTVQFCRGLSQLDGVFSSS